MVLVVSLGASALWADEVAPKLRYNPFKRPDLSQRVSTPVKQAVTTTLAWTPELRATLVAGKQSMVNVDGEIVMLGEEIRGYRLVEVREHEAVFAKGVGRITVTMAARSKPSSDKVFRNLNLGPPDRTEQQQVPLKDSERQEVTPNPAETPLAVPQPIEQRNHQSDD